MTSTVTTSAVEEHAQMNARVGSMIRTTHLNPILVHAAGNQLEDAFDGIHPVVPPLLAIKSELLELQLYSSVWAAVAAGAGAYFFLPREYAAFAVLGGAAIPWLAGKEANYQFHVFLSTLMTFDPAKYTKQ